MNHVEIVEQKRTCSLCRCVAFMLADELLAFSRIYIVCAVAVGLGFTGELIKSHLLTTMVALGSPLPYHSTFTVLGQVSVEDIVVFFYLSVIVCSSLVMCVFSPTVL